MELSFSRCSSRCVIATSLLLLTLPAFSQIAKGDRLLSNGAVPSTGSLEPLATAGYSFSSADSDYNLFAGVIAADYLTYTTGSLAFGGGLYFASVSLADVDFSFTQFNASARLRYGLNVSEKIHVYGQVSPSYRLETTLNGLSGRFGQSERVRITETTVELTPLLGALLRLNQHSFADFAVGFSLPVLKSVGGSATEQPEWSPGFEELYTQTSNSLRINVSPIARLGAGSTSSSGTSLESTGIAKGSWLVGGSGASLTVQDIGSSVRTAEANEVVLNTSAYRFVNQRLAVGGDVSFQKIWNGQFTAASVVNVQPGVRYYLAPTKASTVLLGAGVAVASRKNFDSWSSGVGVQVETLYVVSLRPGVFGELGPVLRVEPETGSLLGQFAETGTTVGFVAGLQFALAGRSKLDQ